MTDFQPKPCGQGIRIRAFSCERGTTVKRNIVILVVGVAALGVFLWQMPDPGRDGRVTLKEIQARIAREKAELKAELAAAGRPYETGTLQQKWGHANRYYTYEPQKAAVTG